MLLHTRDEFRAQEDQVQHLVKTFFALFITLVPTRCSVLMDRG